MKGCIKRGAGFQLASGAAPVLVTLGRFESHLKLFQEDVLEKKEKINLSQRGITDDRHGRGSEKLIRVMRIT